MFRDTNSSDHALLRLVHLVSPTLPIGAYAFSRGLEQAVDVGWVHDARSACDWVLGSLERTGARLDAPICDRARQAWEHGDEPAVAYWAALCAACRETRELAEEDRHLGQALARLLVELGLEEAAPWRDHEHASHPVLFALAAARWRVPRRATLAGLLWSMCENQVVAAIRLVPLGQTAGHRMLADATDLLPAHVDTALALDDSELGPVAPGLAVASAWHETQYTRLFRS